MRYMILLIKCTELKDTPKVLGTDETASITGIKAGFIRCLEEKLERPLQWVVCLFHCNELPLRHMFLKLGGATKSLNRFCEPVGKKLNGKVSTWLVKIFELIENANFAKLPDDIVDDLNLYQYYGYRLCRHVSILGP